MQDCLNLQWRIYILMHNVTCCFLNISKTVKKETSEKAAEAEDRTDEL